MSGACLGLNVKFLIDTKYLIDVFEHLVTRWRSVEPLRGEVW